MLRDGLGSFAANGLVLTGRLQATSNNGLVATGTYGLGTIPEQNAGVRMMWYPRRAAFRAGAVEMGSPFAGTEWNDGSIGEGSTAFGTNTLASGNHSVAMGKNSRATGIYSFAMGLGAIASAQSAFAVGEDNTASGIGSFAIGTSNTASGHGAVALGLGNVASGDVAVALGGVTTASGAGSVAMGYAASTNAFAGSFVFGDYSTYPGGSEVTATAPNQFVVRADGGIFMYSTSDLSVGVGLPSGAGSWTTVSDRNRKRDFRDLDPEETLQRLRHIPVTEWSYTAQGPVRHVGPMAQDFRAAFGLGVDDVTITGSDLDGVNMLAIQALTDRTDKLRTENAALRDEVAGLKRRLERLEALLSRP